MPKHHASNEDASYVRSKLKRPGLRHLRARHRSDLITVESGPTHDRVRHVRFRRDTVHLWILEIANHRGAWERTPYRDLLPKLIELVIEEIPWVLQRAE